MCVRSSAFYGKTPPRAYARRARVFELWILFSNQSERLAETPRETTFEMPSFFTKRLRKSRVLSRAGGVGPRGARRGTRCTCTGRAVRDCGRSSGTRSSRSRARPVRPSPKWRSRETASSTTSWRSLISPPSRTASPARFSQGTLVEFSSLFWNTERRVRSLGSLGVSVRSLSLSLERERAPLEKARSRCRRGFVQ